MSMTREEAINWIADLCDRYSKQAEEYEKQGALIPMDAMYPYIQALGVALTALRPVSREQVEKVFSGCSWCNNEGKRPENWECSLLDDRGFSVVAGDEVVWTNAEFCPVCGKPLTDEAVDIELRRWKEAVDNEA